MGHDPHPDDIPLPALLRAARGAYRHAIQKRLADAGFDDLPRNGPFVLGGIANHDAATGDLIRQLGVSKQAASQLIDVLVLRGYLERQVDAEDRRRMTIIPTERGREAAAAVRAGVQEVDGELALRLSSAQLAGLHAGLEALCAIREAAEVA